MKKFNRQVYTDLEKEHSQEKHESLRMEVIEMLVKKYPNDADLGKEVREFIKVKNKL